MYQATYDNGSLSLKINEVEVPLSNVIDTVKLTYDSGTSELACGVVIIPTLEFTLLNTVTCVLMDTVELNVGNIPFHKFIVVSADKQEYITKFKAYVEPYGNLSKGFFGDLENGYTVRSMLNEIATKTGVTIDGIDSLPNLLLTRGDVTATGDDGTEQTQKGTNYEGKTYLEQLSLISGLLGKNIIFTRDNHIKFTNLNTTDIVLTDLEKPNMKTNSYRVNKIICQTGRDTELVSGSATLSETLSLSNCYMTQEQLNALLTQFQAIEYEAFEFNHAQANLLIEPYDMVSFEYKGQNYVIPVQYLQIVFSAKGANYIVKSFVKQGESAVSEYKGTLTSRVDNVYTEVMQVRQLIANIGQFEEIEAVVAKIDNLYAKVGHIQNLLAGTITSEEIDTIHLTSQNAVIDNAVVKSEMIESLAVSKLASGVIDTSKIQIQATNGHMTIADNTIRFVDSNGNTRLYMGEDTNGNFSYQVYNANGSGLLLDENGLKEIAITDGLIKTNMINNQAITGDKINWTSFCESFNSSTNTNTLDSAHITMDGKRLDTAFNQLNTTVNGQTETINTHTSQLTQNANAIQGLVTATTITKEDGTTVGVKDEIANMKLTQDNFQVSISEKVDNIQVGGRNLLVGSDDGYLNDLTVYELISDLTSNMVDGWKRFNITTQLVNKEIVHEHFFIPSDLGVYTFSIECRTDATSFVIPGISLYTYELGHFHSSTKTIKISNNHYKITSTFDLAKSPTGYTLGTPIRMVDLQGVTTVGATYLEFRYPKVEKGNIASDWSQAPEDVDTSITNAKNEAISSANNTLNSTIANYYTKEETNSQINVAKNEINLGVSSLRTEVMNASYNNLLWNSDFLTWENYFPKGYYSTNRTYCTGGGWICPDGGKTILIDTSGGGIDWQGFQSSMVRVRQDQTLTASVYVAIDNEAYRGTVNFGIEILWLGADYNRISAVTTFFTIDTLYEWQRVPVTGTAPEGTVYAQVYCWNQTVGVSWWGKPMLQFGSVMTAWTRGGDLERVDERLSNAELKITDDAIISTVSSVYETKEVVESKTNTALDNAKLYADTKKSEAISTASSDATNKANQAKNDAIASANNTLNTTITNYYTKEETNSQINVAKNEINLGVSQTYETKTEVTNKMNNAIVASRTIPDTRETNETPHWYMSNYPFQTVTEFKRHDRIGLPDNGMAYYTMTTTVPWNDSSGGRPTQVARTSISEHTYERVAISDTEWSAWLKIENASSAERRVNSAKEEMRSEINIAKDAVTTTVSNLRTEIMNATYSNLLSNSDFLTLENNFPKGYYSDNASKCYMGGWICPEGGQTIHINTNDGGNWIGFRSSNIKARQDQVFTASVYVAIDNSEYVGSVGFGLEIEWIGADGNRISTSGSTFTMETAYNWERHSVTGIAPEGTVSARIFCWNQTTGVSWWGKPMLQIGSVMTAWDRGGDFEKVDERLSYAEQKITDESITNTVRQNFYTKQETENSITSKGYATSSQVQQTADSLTATFTKSGGCNLFRNSGFKCTGDAYRHWYVWNPQGLVNSGNFEINRASDGWGFPSYATDSLVIHVVNPTGDGYVEYGAGQTIDTTIGQTYTVSCYHAMHRVTSATIVVRDGDGHWMATQGLDTSKMGGNGNVVNWGRATLTFTATGTRHSIEFMLHGVNSEGNAYMWIAQPMCNEGSVAQPYSIHPNEAYDGVVMMDYDGIKVSATGFGGYTHMTKDGFYLNNGSTDVFYVNGDGLKIGSNPTTSINGDVIRSGNIVSNNGDLTFNLNTGQMYYKYANSQVGFLGVTDGNSFSLSTDAKGWCMNSDYGSFSSLGAKSASGGNYIPYLTVTSGGVSNYNAGIFLSMPLNYGSATGTNMTVKNALELSAKVDGSGLFNPKISWRGTDVVTGASLFPRSGGDRIDIYSTGDSNVSNLTIRLADDVNTYFKITCNHFTYGHQAIATFRYVTSIDGYGIDFYRGLNMHNYNLGNVALKNAKSVQTASLALLDDVATVQTASPTAMYALDNGIEATQATITQHIATSINKTVTFNGTELVEGTSEYIELPQDFLMCVDIQVTLTPNKLCQFAVTSKDEYGFVIETDTEGVTFDYVVIGTKMNGTLFTGLHEVEPDTCPINDEEEYVPCTTDNLMLPQEFIDKGYTTFADATEEEMEAMKFEQVFGSPIEEEEEVTEDKEVTEEDKEVTKDEVTKDEVIEDKEVVEDKVTEEDEVIEDKEVVEEPVEEEDEVTEETQEDIIIENEDDLNGIDTGTIIENY